MNNLHEFVQRHGDSFSSRPLKRSVRKDLHDRGVTFKMSEFTVVGVIVCYLDSQFHNYAYQHHVSFIEDIRNIQAIDVTLSHLGIR